ncbi:MAG: MATE family efflux transporter [Pseudomonadota bacterium]
MSSTSLRRRLSRELGALLRLAAPIIVNNLATTGTGFFDTVMSGRLGPDTLAAVAIGHALFMMPYLLGLGLLMAVNPLTAHRFGAGEIGRVGRLFRQALWLAIPLALLLMLALQGTDVVLRWIGIDPQVVPQASGYVRAHSLGLPALFAFLVLRYTSEGIGHTTPILITAVVGFVVNVIGNYVLMFGHFGFPALGAVGCGLASALAYCSMFATLLTYVLFRRRVYRRLNLFSRFEWPRVERLREIIGLGLPIGGSVLAEASLFSCVGLMMGTIGANVAGAHQIAINYAATMFMLPLSIHNAVTVRVGHALGAGHGEDAHFRAWLGVALCAAFMSASALVMLAFGEQIVGFYVRPGEAEEVRAVAISLLGMAALFQISDGVQVGAAGALRGYKDTRLPFFINVFSYWGIGFPLAYVLGIVLDRGPQSVWMGLVVGLTVCAILLSLRLWRVSRRPWSAPITEAQPGAL